MSAGWMAACFVLAYYGASLWICRSVHIGVREIAYSGLTCALVVLLTYLRLPLPTPFGTAVTVEYIPLILLAVLVDYRLATITGIVCGLVVAMVGPGWSMMHWAQLVLEQLLCFSCLGYAGIFGKGKKKRTWGVLLAMFIAFVGHVLSGVIFYGQYALEGWGVWTYSLVYNCSYMVPDTIVAVLMVRALPIETLLKVIKRGAAA